MTSATAPSPMEMKTARARGETLREIGDRYGISHERVRQILIKTFGTTDFGAPSRRGTGRTSRRTLYDVPSIDSMDDVARAALDEYVRKILTKIAEDPMKVSPNYIVMNCPVRASNVQQVMGNWIWTVTWGKTDYSDDGPADVVDEQIYKDIRTVWENSPYHPGPISLQQYSRLREPQMLSGGRIGQRMKWTDACARAGVPTNAPHRKSYKRITHEIALTAVLGFVEHCADNAETTTARNYEKWAADVGAPALPTIRTVDGGLRWSDIRAEAIKTVLKARMKA